jgi:hypothetical protein
MTILDQTEDLAGTERHRLVSLYEPPAFVKLAGAKPLGDAALPDHVYADQPHRKYPCHNAAATWTSALFFFDKRAALSPARAQAIETRLLQAADYFNIRHDVDVLQQKVAAANTYNLQQLPDSAFALVWDDQGSKERHYPLRNAAEVKTAADWFLQHRTAFHFTDRQQIASRILEKAAAFSADVPLETSEVLSRTAGYGYCPASDVIDMLQVRSQLAKRSKPGLSQELQKLASLVAETGLDVRDAGTRCKLAEVVDMFDHQTHLTQMYDDGGLDRPEDVLFQVTEKVASDFVTDHVQLTSGTIYEKAALAGCDREVVTQWLGDEFAEAISSAGDLDTEKLAAILPTLPRPDAELFDQMATSCGVTPYARDKAASGGLTLDTLREWAQLYTDRPLQPAL